MLPEHLHWIWAQFEPGDGEPWSLQTIARQLVAEGDLHAAATVYDRAFGLDPSIAEIRRERAELLDRLAVVEHGLVFRYIPAGAFLMGCPEGEPDEQPWHPVWLSHFWLTEVPLSWADYCRLLGWTPPPGGHPVNEEDLSRDVQFDIFNSNKIRLQYCEDQTIHARDWHAHAPEQKWVSGTGQEQTAEELFGRVPRADPQAPRRYDTKPVVAIGWDTAFALGKHLTTTSVRYNLPTEAQWEKAARGGLIASCHAWGNEPPDHQRCDFNRFQEFSIQPARTYPPNDYGLYAMNGGVWEWTGDWYDRDYYREAPANDPQGPPDGKEKIIRGGSWADCAAVVTVSFRSACLVGEGRYRRNDGGGTPNIGIRLCREAHSS